MIGTILTGFDPDVMPARYQNGKLEIRKDVKRPYYFVRITEPAISGGGVRFKRRVPKILGFVDQISKKQAMDLRAQVLERINSHRVLAQSHLIFKDVAQQFMDVRVPQLGPAVRERYPSQIRKHLLPAFGALRLSAIDRPMVEQFCNAKKAEGLAPWTVTGLKGVLSAIFTTAKSWKLFDGDNPCEGVRVKKRCVREKRLLTGDQLIALLAALDVRERFIVQVLFGLGLRISECLGLRWSDLDLDAGIVAIRRRWYRGEISDEETKSEAGTRSLQLGAFLTGEFKRRYPGPHKRDEFVFLEPGTLHPPDDRDLLREYFRPIVKRCGLYYEGFGFHVFRRQNITMRQQAGATPMEAMKAAGHGSVDMVLLYTQQDRERERGHVDAMFAGIGTLPPREIAGWGAQ